MPGTATEPPGRGSWGVRSWRSHARELARRPPGCRARPADGYRSGRGEQQRGLAGAGVGAVGDDLAVVVDHGRVADLVAGRDEGVEVLHRPAAVDQVPADHHAVVVDRVRPEVARIGDGAIAVQERVVGVGRARPDGVTAGVLVGRRQVRQAGGVDPYPKLYPSPSEPTSVTV